MGDPGPDHQNMLTGTASTEASAIPAMSRAEATHSAEFSGSILHDLLNSIQTFAGQGAGPAEEHRRPNQTQRRSEVRGVRSLQARLPTLYSGNSREEFNTRSEFPPLAPGEQHRRYRDNRTRQTARHGQS